MLCFAAASVGLPIAVISFAKLMLFLGGVMVLVNSKSAASTPSPSATNLKNSKSTLAVLTVLGLFTLSLSWTSASAYEALSGLSKYGKLLVIPIILALTRTRHEALLALAAFATTQLFLLMSSTLQFAGVFLPWVISRGAVTQYATFSSYLDQGIMNAVFAGICWHFRGLVPGRFGPQLAIVIAMVALFNVFFVFQGRSGHAVAIALLSLALMWQLPGRYKMSIVVLPLLLLLVISTISPKVGQRIDLLKNEVSEFSIEKGANVIKGTSSGIRLHLWHRALQSISQHPIQGSGVGSWNAEFNRLEHLQNPKHRDIPPVGNPHQEYLLWGVQLGVPGIVLFLLLMACILVDSLKMTTSESRAVQSVLGALAVACLFNAALYDALIGDFFCILTGLLLALGRTSLSASKSKPSAA